MFCLKHLFKYRVLSHILLTASWVRVGTNVGYGLLFTMTGTSPGCGPSDGDDFNIWSKGKGQSLGVLAEQAPVKILGCGVGEMVKCL